MNPFSRKQLSLPFLTAVNSIVQKFVTFQLVKCVHILNDFVLELMTKTKRRYPLIFGPWAQVRLHPDQFLFQTDECTPSN